MRRAAALALVVASGACRFSFEDHQDAAPDVAGDAKAACPADAILCDDFELGDLSRWSGTQGGTNPIMADTAMPHFGTYSLDARVLPATGNGGEAFVYKTLAAIYDHLTARAWFYFPDPIESFQGVIYLVDLPAENHYLEVVTDDTGWGVVGNGGTLMDYNSNVPIASEQWTCVELDLDRLAGRFQLYIGDAIAIDTAVADPSRTFGVVGVGATRANADGYHVFADDVVIATSHIGCD